MAQATAAAEGNSPPMGKVKTQDEPGLTRTSEFQARRRATRDRGRHPVDSMFSETQQRLLTGVLKESWNGPEEGRPFIVAANVGVFISPYEPPVVPDVFLSLDVRRPPDWWDKPGRSYLSGTTASRPMWSSKSYPIPKPVKPAPNVNCMPNLGSLTT